MHEPSMCDWCGGDIEARTRRLTCTRETCSFQFCNGCRNKALIHKDHEMVDSAPAAGRGGLAYSDPYQLDRATRRLHPQHSQEIEPPKLKPRTDNAATGVHPPSAQTTHLAAAAPLTKGDMESMLSGLRSDLASDMRKNVSALRSDMVEEFRMVRQETAAQLKKVREENSLAVGEVKDDLTKMEARLKKLEEKPQKNKDDSDFPNRDTQVVVTGWIEEVEETEVVERIRRFLSANNMESKVKDVFCFADPSNFGIIEFESIAATRGFLKKLRAAGDLEIDDEKKLRFAPNRTLVQRAQDRRLGQIKHQLFTSGHALDDIKIIWRRNVVKLGKKIVYKLRLDTKEHEYLEEAMAVQDVVEDYVKLWVSQRDSGDSD